MANKKSLWAALMLSGLLTACGGGGDDKVVDTTPHVSTGTMAGVVATGAALAYANVIIKDVNGTTTTATTDSEGRFTLSLTNTTGPYIIKATSVDGTTSLYAIALDEDFGSALSVSPFSSIVLANVFGKDPATAFAELSPATAGVVDTKLRPAVTNLHTSLTPLFTALGVTVAEPNDLMMSFLPDHTGIDRVLDAITVAFSGGNAVITDKMGNTILTDNIASNTDVPTAVVPADIATTADAALGIGNYLVNLTRQCGTIGNYSQACADLGPASGFKHSRSAGTFESYVNWYEEDGVPTALEYNSPQIKFIDETGVWVEFTYVVSTAAGSTTFKDSGYFKEVEGDWYFIGDQSTTWLDLTYDKPTASVLWKVRSKTLNPETKHFAYIRLTSPAFNAEVKLYKNADRWPDEFDNYVMQNCTAVLGIPESANTTCSSGFTYYATAYPIDTLVPVHFQMVDTDGNDVVGWGANATVRLHYR